MSSPFILLAAFLLSSAVLAATSSARQSVKYASETEVAEWLKSRHNERIVVETDSLTEPVQKLDKVPLRWTTRGSEGQRFEGTARPDQFYVFQVSLYNTGSEPISIRSVAVTTDQPKIKQAVCVNEAVNVDKSGMIVLPAHRIQPLWIGIQSQTAGAVSGKVQIKISLDESGQFQQVDVPYSFRFEGPTVTDEGVNEAANLSRLKWLLPSDLGISAKPTRGYLPVKRSGQKIDVTSIRLTLGADGLPAQIESKGPSSLKLLHAPATFNVQSENGPLRWSEGKLVFDDLREDRSTWRSVRQCEQASLACEGVLEFDGFVRYRLKLTAKKPLSIIDASLDVPYRADSAKYQLGLGFKGGFTPDETNWKWNVAYQQDCVWLGDVSAGAQWRFKGENYRRPLVNIYYGYQPLALPESWGNEGRGGIHVLPPSNDVRMLHAYSGSRHLSPGESLEFNFDLQITPSRPLDTDKQWATRFYHPNSIPGDAALLQPIETAKASGANVVNMHHRTQVNPFINYPFNDFSVPDLKQFVDSAHKDNIRIKLYYTTRELTWKLPEIWALKSFGGSIIEPGPGPATRTVINSNGPSPLLTEALGDNFIPAWTNELEGKYAGIWDLAVITRPDSSWNDYYLHGLDWLVKKVHIDGVYIDDTALDRVSLQRARRILEADRPDPLIDLHSWNHENPLAAQGSSTSIYLELFPYIDRLWLGEGFDYQHATPDYWLVSMSGLPFGVMSEMLEGGGNVWRGMLFGETCRLGWSGDPRSMWKFWDQVGMKGSQMIGWWDSTCPVRTDSKDVLATVYKKAGKAVVAISNWSEASKRVNLKIDWKSLGISSQARFSAPEIAGFQPAASWRPGQEIEVPAGKGWLIVITPSGTAN